MTKVRVTYHALDRASQRLLHRWEKERHPEEGLYSWLWRMACRAGQNVTSDAIVRYRGIRFVFRKKGKRIVLATVY